MRGITQLQLSDGQQKRLAKAKEGLKDCRGNVHTSAFVNIGDTISVDHEAGFLRFTTPPATADSKGELQII